MVKQEQIAETDIAYAILRTAGCQLHFRDLITQVLAQKGAPVHSQSYAMAEVHTQINIDSRFCHMGKGYWGLTEWVPQRRTVSRSTDEAANKPDSSNLRREKLLAEIQQDYEKVETEPEPEEHDDNL